MANGYFLFKKAGALIFAYIIMATLFTVGAIHIKQASQEATDMGRYIRLQQAFWLAESGFEEGAFELEKDEWVGWDSSSGVKTLSQSGVYGDYDIAIHGAGNKSCTIFAIGYSPSKTAEVKEVRKLKIDMRRQLAFEYAAFGKYDLDISNNAHSNSYHSSRGAYHDVNNAGFKGDVGTNGSSMVIKNRGYIFGNASVGYNGEILIENSGGYSGYDSYDNDVYLPPVDIPDSVEVIASGGRLNVSGNTTLPAGDYRFSEIDVSGSGSLILEGDVNIYVDGEFSVTGNGQVTVNGSTELYVGGDITVWGNGIANTTTIPSNLLIYGSGDTDQDIALSGDADLYGAIYAPEANVVVDGNGDVYGAITGGDVDLVGGGWIHYDEDLFDYEIGGFAYVIDKWKELF